MTKYKVTLCISTYPQVSFIIEAKDYDALGWFIYRFYPDTNWDYEVMK
jgi:hypothetical protein